MYLHRCIPIAHSSQGNQLATDMVAYMNNLQLGFPNYRGIAKPYRVSMMPAATKPDYLVNALAYRPIPNSDGAMLGC